MSPLGYRPADPVRRPHRPTRSSSCAASCIRCGISASWSATRCASSTSSRRWRRTTPSSCWRCSTRGRWPGFAVLFERFRRVFHTASTHAYILKSLLELIDERHAGFNATLYQLEPDVKEAPGALRDLTATRTIAMLTDPLLLRRGPADPARFDRGGGFPAARAFVAASECGSQSERAQPRAAGANGGAAGISRRRAASARRAADERLLPARAHRQPLARLGAQGRRRCRSGRTSASRATASASSIRFRRRATPRPGLGRFRPRSMPIPTVSEEALSCIQQHVDRYRADDFFPDASDQCGVARSAQAAAGTLRRVSRRCTTAGCSGACSPSSRRSRGGWCATSTTSTRSTSTRC